MEVLTKEDLQLFRVQLLDDLKKMLGNSLRTEENFEWVKSAAVRKMLKVSPGTLQNLRISGRINPVKIEGSWYYNLTELRALFTK